MKLLVINGPNLNMLGIREPEIYGKKTYQDLCDMINKYAEDKKISVDIYQSNHEGSIVDCIQQAYFDKVELLLIQVLIRILPLQFYMLSKLFPFKLLKFIFLQLMIEKIFANSVMYHSLPKKQ